MTWTLPSTHHANEEFEDPDINSDGIFLAQHTTCITESPSEMEVSGEHAELVHLAMENIATTALDTNAKCFPVQGMKCPRKSLTPYAPCQKCVALRQRVKQLEAELLVEKNKLPDNAPNLPLWSTRSSIKLRILIAFISYLS